jgi:hypothetical protein
MALRRIFDTSQKLRPGWRGEEDYTNRAGQYTMHLDPPHFPVF